MDLFKKCNSHKGSHECMIVFSYKLHDSFLTVSCRISIAESIALDDALGGSCLYDRLKFGKCIIRLEFGLSHPRKKTFQVVLWDCAKLTPFTRLSKLLLMLQRSICRNSGLLLIGTFFQNCPKSGIGSLLGPTPGKELAHLSS
ncbi:hypothetical protein Tco_0363740 [Tanacetum coccineum]